MQNPSARRRLTNASLARRVGRPCRVPRFPACAAMALAAALGLLSAGSAGAAKWSECPKPPLPVYPSTLGATNAPFVHPGHELRIVLNSAQAASGGFGVEPESNTVEISFAPLFGEAVFLSPLRVAAVSPSILTFPFPDPAAETGRVLTGPVEIRVTNGETLVARIDPADLVALPPATDVTALLLGEELHRTIYGAVGLDGDLWVPARFHGDPNTMPMCTGEFMLPMPIEIGAATIPGLSLRRVDPLHRIRRARLYLGDFDVDGENLYGMLFPQRVSLVHVGGTRGIAICQLNDALDLVLRVKGSRSWARSARSPIREVVQDASPVPLVLQGAQPLPDTARVRWTAGNDSFGNRCEPEAPIADAPRGKP